MGEKRRRNKVAENFAEINTRTAGVHDVPNYFAYESVQFKELIYIIISVNFRTKIKININRGKNTSMSSESLINVSLMVSVVLALTR